MSRVVAGTLLLPNGQPMANASIYFTAKRTEAVSIIEGSNTFFTTNNAGVYNQTVVNGWYAVSIEYIADSSGAHTRRWSLGDVFVEDGAASTLEALIIASNQPSDLPLTLFYEILADAQQAAADAQAAAIAAAASAASIAIGTAPTNVPNNTILNNRLGTTGNLGTAAQATIVTTLTDTTTSRVPTTGWMGLGRSGGIVVPDIDAIVNVGFWCAEHGSSPLGAYATVLHMAYSEENCTQIGGQTLTDNDLKYRKKISGVWGSPKTIYHSGNQLSLGTTSASARTAIDSSVLPAYTVSTVPSASANPNKLVVVTNAASGRNMYLSDGTNWRDPARVILS